MLRRKNEFRDFNRNSFIFNFLKLNIKILKLNGVPHLSLVALAKIKISKSNYANVRY